MGKKKPKQRVTRYYSSIQYAICHGIIEKLVSFKVNDKTIGRCSAGLEGPVVYVNDPELFGGIKKEGGLQGRLAWQPGNFTQLLDSYVAEKKGSSPSDLPGYRGIGTAFFTEWPGGETPAGAAETSLLRSVVTGGSVLAGLSYLASFINGTRRPGIKGFYWSANQPVIPPVYFRVTRIDRTWRPDIAAIAGDIDLIDHAVCISLDFSGSMSFLMRAAVRRATVSLLNELKRSPNSASFDIRIIAWNSTNITIQRRNCTPQDYEDLIAFVIGISDYYTGGTDFRQAVVGIEEFYSGSNGKCRTFMFLTDGVPTNPASATDAAATLASTGARSYAYNFVETDTTYTALMDNTSEDGIPVIRDFNGQDIMAGLFALSATNQVDMNPAHIIRECLVNSVWGLGLPESLINDEMFEAAAETLFLERFGLSMMWTKQSKIEEFIGDVLAHIQGTLYVNPMTGRICLKLIRDDYDVETLDVLTPSNCTVTSFKRRTPAEITNEIAVTWTNPLTEKEEVVTKQSLGSIVANNGEIVSDNRNYYGIRRRALAAQVCARDLGAATAPLSTAEVRADRRFSQKVPGDVIKLTDPENGASEVVMRIMKINYGYVGSSEVEMSLTEDVFSYAKPRVDEQQVPMAPPPAQYPAPPTTVEAITINALMAQTLSGASNDLVEPETHVAIFASTDRTDTFGIEIYEEVNSSVTGGVFESTGEYSVIGRFILDEILPAEVESELVLPAAPIGTQPEVGGTLIIGQNGLPEDRHELALIKSFDIATGRYTITRAIFDTIPFEWLPGTPVRYLNSTTKVVVPSELVSGVASDFRVHTRTSRGLLSDDMAPVLTVTPTDRLYAPSRPANVQVEGVAFGVIDGLPLTDIEVTFAHRNRVEEDAVLLRWDEPSVTPEVGQTATVRLIDYDSGIVVAEYAGITGTSYTFPAADRAFANAVSVTVLSERDGFESIQAHSVLVQFPDFMRRLEDSDDERATETGDFRRTED